MKAATLSSSSTSTAMGWRGERGVEQRGKEGGRNDRVSEQKREGEGGRREGERGRSRETRERAMKREIARGWGQGGRDRRGALMLGGG